MQVGYSRSAQNRWLFDYIKWTREQVWGRRKLIRRVPWRNPSLQSCPQFEEGLSQLYLLCVSRYCIWLSSEEIDCFNFRERPCFWRWNLFFNKDTYFNSPMAWITLAPLLCRHVLRTTSLILENFSVCFRSYRTISSDNTAQYNILREKYCSSSAKMPKDKTEDARSCSCTCGRSSCYDTIQFLHGTYFLRRAFLVQTTIPCQTGTCSCVHDTSRGFNFGSIQHVSSKKPDCALYLWPSRDIALWEMGRDPFLSW